MKPHYLKTYIGIQSDVSGPHIFNHRYKHIVEYNFTFIDKAVEDIALFELIQSETELQRANKQEHIHLLFDDKLQSSQDLLEALNFDVSTILLYSLAVKDFKAHTKDHPYQIELLKDDELPELLAFIAQEDLVYKDPSYSSDRQHLFAHLQKNKAHAIYIAKDGDTIIGTLCTHRFKDWIEFDCFYVHEDYRNQGVGTSLQLLGFQDSSTVLCKTLLEDKTHSMYEAQNFKLVSSHLSAVKAID